MNSVMRSLFPILALLLLVGGIAMLATSGMPTTYGLALPVWALVLAMIAQWLGFLHAYAFQTERYYDLIGALSNIAVVVFVVALAERADARSYLLAACILFWALRLGSFLFLRILKDGGDGRFDDIKPHFFRFLLTWTLQGVWIFLIQLCALLAIGADSTENGLGLFALLGSCCWLAGMLIESFADWQKRQFRANPANDGRFINVGLWAWSRHPNYFGEILVWLGVAVIALPVLNGWMLLGLLSPCFVIFLLTKVSGVPLLEERADKRWGAEPEYIKYKNMTPVLLPKAPRKA
jgi:steroid 5-alpha reductase family enzyme